MVDPLLFLKDNKDGMVLDEAQQLPELFSYIQVLVDEGKSLRFVLSGSNNFTLMEKINQSLAGRAALLTLLLLSVSEIASNDTTYELMVQGFIQWYGAMDDVHTMSIPTITELTLNATSVSW